MGIDLGRLEEVLDAGKAARGGTHPANLSPHATIVQYLFMSEKDRLTQMLARRGSGVVRVLLPTEVEIPPDVDRALLTNAIFV